MGAWVETRDDTYNNSILTAIFVLTGIFVLIYIPFCCYCSYRLHASRDEAFIKVRKSILSHIIIINSILFILQRLIVTDYLYCIGFNECLYHNYHLSSFLSPPNDGSAASNTIEMSEIFPNINAFFNILWLVSCTPKIFWVWYELSLQNAFSNQEWWRQINDKLGENIFIKYHNNIYTYSAVALMLYVIISIFICYLFNTFGQFVIYGLTSIIIIIALPLMLYKLPQIDDIFYLRLELNECIILYIPMIIFFNISTIFIYNPSQIWHIVDIAVFMISNAILCYIVTIRPINLLFEAKSSSKLELTAKSSNHSPIQSSIKSQPNKPTPVALSYKAHSRSNSTTTPTHSTRLQYQHSANSKPNSRQNSPRYGSQSNMNNINLKVSCDILESEIIEYNENLSHPNTNPMSYQYSNPKDSFCGTIDENTEISAEHDEKYYEESMQISIRSQTSNKPLPAALTNGNISASPSFSIDDAIPKTWSGWISKSTDNFNRFMQTLTAELAVENLLFIIEVTQYKRKIIKKIIKLQDGGGRKSPVSLSRNNSSRNNDRGFPNIDTNAPNSRSVSRTEQSISTHAMQQFSSKTGINY